jgi:hypothetical protein
MKFSLLFVLLLYSGTALAQSSDYYLLVGYRYRVEPGTTISFTTSDFPGVWQEGIFTDFNVKDSIVLMEDRVVKLNRFSKFRFSKSRKLWRNIGLGMEIAAYQGAGFFIADVILNHFRPGVAIVIGSTWVAGRILRWFGKNPKSTIIAIGPESPVVLVDLRMAVPPRP